MPSNLRVFLPNKLLTPPVLRRLEEAMVQEAVLVKLLDIGKNRILYCMVFETTRSGRYTEWFHFADARESMIRESGERDRCVATFDLHLPTPIIMVNDTSPADRYVEEVFRACLG